MAWLIAGFDTKPDSLSSVPGTTCWKLRTYSTSCLLCPHAFCDTCNLCVSMCAHIYTHTLRDKYARHVHAHSWVRNKFSVHLELRKKDD